MTTDRNTDYGSEAGERPTRVIHDPDGRRWVVREVQSAVYDRRSDKSLQFDCDAVIRRVRSYPPDWFERSDSELYALSLRT